MVPAMTSTIFFRNLGWMLLLAAAVVTLSPIELRPVTEAPADIERFVAFAMIGGGFCLGYPKHRFGMIVLVIGIVGVLEAAQQLVPGRHAQIYDAAFKALGVFFGARTAVFADRRQGG